MTNAISTYGRVGQADIGLNSSSAQKAEREERGGAVGVRAPESAAPAPALGDTLVLSEVARRDMSGEVFDRDKVEAIKQAIHEGQYPLDARRIAESFATLERLIHD